MAALVAASTAQSRPASPGAPDPLAQVMAVYERCLGPFVGKLGSAVVHVELTDRKEVVRIALALPRFLRAESQRAELRSTLLVRDGKSYLTKNGGPAVLATGDDAAHAMQWVALLRAATLEPLATATRVTRQGPTVFALFLANGETWRLELDAARSLPLALSGPECDLRFGTFVETGPTAIPKGLTSKELGNLVLKIEDADVAFDEHVFDDVGTRLDARMPRRTLEQTVGGERRPKKPQVQSVAADLLLIVPDPGEWQPRIERVLKEMTALREQGQDSAGLPLFLVHDGKECIGIPFRADPERALPFVQRPTQSVLRRATHLVAALHLQKTSLADAVRTGQPLLEAFLTERKLVAKGPLRAIPYVASFSSESGRAQDYSKIDVRLEIPIE